MACVCCSCCIAVVYGTWAIRCTPTATSAPSRLHFCAACLVSCIVSCIIYCFCLDFWLVSSLVSWLVSWLALGSPSAHSYFGSYRVLVSFLTRSCLVLDSVLARSYLALASFLSRTPLVLIWYISRFCLVLLSLSSRSCLIRVVLISLLVYSWFVLISYLFRYSLVRNSFLSCFISLLSLSYCILIFQKGGRRDVRVGLASIQHYPSLCSQERVG